MGLSTLQGMNEFTSPVSEMEESVVDDSFNVEPRHEVELDEQAREFDLHIPPKKPSLLNKLAGKVRELIKLKLTVVDRFARKLFSKLRAKLVGKTADKFVSKLGSKPINDRLDPSV
jgi:hypothetical protein